MNAPDPHSRPPGELLVLQNIEKAFFGVPVLKAVSVSVPRGGALGLVGENGAGKSTLMNILGGSLQPDAGTLRLNGERYAPANPQEATRRGIAFIHQELSLFPNLSITENLFLAAFPMHRFSRLINRAESRRRATELLEQVGLEVPPGRLVATLSAGERQLVEIAKALRIDAQLIIFDEPTTSLSVREADRLFALIASLRARGIAIIYVSHTLSEIFRLCDDVVVLRDGGVVGRGAVNIFTPEKLVSLMVGRDVSQLVSHRKNRPSSTALLEVVALSRPPLLQGVSLTLCGGEILGLFGLMGAGRSELARAIFGLDARRGGEVRIAGEVLHRLAPRQWMRRRVAFLTENRRAEGLCLDGSVAENLTLASLRRYVRGPLRWLRARALATAATGVFGAVRIDAKVRQGQAVRTLSGGNQQKVVLGKWLLCEPRVLILDEPTRGIDVGAKFEIYRLIRDLADAGAGVLLISSEMDELIGLCDRILVMRRGQIADALPRAEFDRERILRAALHPPLPGEAAP